MLSYAFNEGLDGLREHLRGLSQRWLQHAAGSPTRYEPESIRNYEIGTKFAMADGRVNFEGAAFFTKYDDMVRRGLVQIGTTLDSLLSNIGEAEIKGVEAGITLQPAQGFTLSANAAWLNAEVTALESDGAPEDRVNFAGDSLDYIPKFSYSLGANYAFQLGADLPAFVRIDFNHRDKVEYTDRSSFPAENLPQFSDAFNLLNLRAGFERNSATFEVFAQNVADANKSVDPYRAWSNANRTRPRLIGVKVGYQF